jgi:hypothetical protein
VVIDYSEIKLAYPSDKSLKIKPPFIDMKSTSQQTLLLSEDGLLFTFDIPNYGIDEEVKNPRMFFMRKLHNIVKIASGLNHFLALKKVVRPPFAEWTPDMVYNWIEQTSLDFVKNVIKYSKIDGKTLINAPDEYYEHTLGILDENKVYKLKHLI